MRMCVFVCRVSAADMAAAGGIFVDAVFIFFWALCRRGCVPFIKTVLWCAGVLPMKGSQALALLPRGLGLSCLPGPFPEQHTLLVGISGGDGLLCKSVSRDNAARNRCIGAKHKQDGAGSTSGRNAAPTAPDSGIALQPLKGDWAATSSLQLPGCCLRWTAVRSPPGARCLDSRAASASGVKPAGKEKSHAQHQGTSHSCSCAHSQTHARKTRPLLQPQKQHCYSQGEDAASRGQGRRTLLCFCPGNPGVADLSRQQCPNQAAKRGDKRPRCCQFPSFASQYCFSGLTDGMEAASLPQIPAACSKEHQQQHQQQCLPQSPAACSKAHQRQHQQQLRPRPRRGGSPAHHRTVQHG